MCHPLIDITIVVHRFKRTRITTILANKLIRKYVYMYLNIPTRWYIVIGAINVFRLCHKKLFRVVEIIEPSPMWPSHNSSLLNFLKLTVFSIFVKSTQSTPSLPNSDYNSSKSNKKRDSEKKLLAPLSFLQE